MLRRLGVLAISALALVVPLASASPAATRTEMVRWSPFDANSQIRSELKVKQMPAGACPRPDSEETGFLYRCGSGNFLLDPCWQEGPNPTEFAVCATDPWSPRVYRLRAPGLLLEAGVTFERS